MRVRSDLSVPVEFQLTFYVDAPRYSQGLIIAASCTTAAAALILLWKLLYRLYDCGDTGVKITASAVPADELDENKK